MAATIAQVVRFVREAGFRCFTDGTSALVPWWMVDRPQNVNIDIHDGGTLVRFTRRGLFNLDGGAHTSDVMARALELTGRLKYVKFGLDPDDGEVFAETVIAVGQGQRIALDRVAVVMASMTEGVNRYAPALVKLMETGDWDEPCPQYTCGQAGSEANEPNDPAIEAAVRRLLGDEPCDVNDDAALDG